MTKGLRAVFATAMAALLVGLTACSNGSTATTPPAVGGTLVDLYAAVTLGADPANPAGTTNDALSQLYDPLVTWGTTTTPEGLRKIDFSKPLGDLAQSWTVANGVYTFKLRPGLLSCANNEFTSADVLWSYQRAKAVTGPTNNPYNILTAAHVFDGKAISKTATAADKTVGPEIAVVDKYTVKITTTPDTGTLIPQLVSPIVAPLDSTLAKAHATADDPWAYTWVGTNGAGFGPYCLGSFTANQSLVLTANKKWKGPFVPYFQTVKMNVVPQSANRLAALQSGDAQIAQGLTRDQYKSLDAAPTGPAHVINNFGSLNVQFRLDYKFKSWGPNGDAKAAMVRQAVAYAIPYDQVVKDGLGGYGKIMNSVIPTSFPNAKTYPNLGVTDLTKAKDLMTQAGYPNGQGFPTDGLKISFASEQSDTWQPIATIIQQALDKIGIKIELAPIPAAQFNTQASVARTLPMALTSGGSGTYDVSFYMNLWFKSKENGGTQGIDNYSNPALDKLVDQALALPSGAARDALAVQMQDIVAKDLPIIAIAGQPGQAAISSKVKNVQLGNVGAYYAAVHAA